MSIIDDDKVELSWFYVSLYCIDKIYNFHIRGFSPFCHSITDIDDFCLTFCERFSHSFTQKIWHNAGIEISRSDNDGISFSYCIFCIWVEVSIISDEPGIDDILIDIM